MVWIQVCPADSAALIPVACWLPCLCLGSDDLHWSRTRRKGRESMSRWPCEFGHSTPYGVSRLHEAHVKHEEEKKREMSRFDRR